MITVTNGIDTIDIDKKYLQKIDNGFLIKPEFDYWMISLIIVMEDDVITKIIKTLPYGERILDNFNNLSQNSNRIMLASDEFSKFKRLYENMRNKDDLKKKVVIEAASQILAYQYYQGKYLEDNQETLMEKERLASLGQLIGGIAHNLKTPIMSISGAAEGLTDLIKEYD